MSTPLVVPGGGPVADAVAAVAVPAQDPAPPPGQGPEFGEASPVALVVILLLGLATVLLIRGMSKRIRRLPESFDPPADPEPGADAAKTDAAKADVAKASADRDAEGGRPGG